MTDAEALLRARLRKIEALHAGAGTAGERAAAAAALDRIKARLRETERQDPALEMRFTFPDQWSRRLFVALARRYGLSPFRYRRQRHTTVMLRVPQRFVDEVMWPEFQALHDALHDYLMAATERIIAEEIHRDTAEAAEVDEPQRLG